MWAATIIHLTDLHLYLEPESDAHRPVSHKASIKSLLWLAYRNDSVQWRTFFKGR
jgi:hypothetical protein